MKVRRLLKKEIISIEGSATLMEAAEKMAQFNVGSLVVTRGGEIVGVVSKRDIVRAVADRLPLALKVEDVASKDVATVDVEDDVYKAARIVRNRWIRHLVVVEGGRPVGVISIRDLLENEAILAMASSIK